MKFKIYKHTSPWPSGKSYIGQTKESVESRFWGGHVKDAKSGSNFRFHQALRKYNPEDFTTEILHECDTKDEANKAEIKYIKEHKTYEYDHGYNMTPGGGGGFHDRKHTIESRQKTSDSMKGQMVGDKNPAKRPEVQQKMSDNHADFNGQNNPVFGKRGYTNGTDNIFIDPATTPPEGFYPGSTHPPRSGWTEETRKTRKALTDAKHTCIWQHKESSEIYQGTAIDLNEYLDVNIDFRAVARGVRKSAKGWICLKKDIVIST